MSDQIQQVDIAEWVDSAKADPVALKQRQATEVILSAIANSTKLQSTMLLKGGVLMGIVYRSPRQTTDIDFTTTLENGDDIDTFFKEQLNNAFPSAAAALGYIDLTIRVQTVKKWPRKKDSNHGSYPALNVKIGFATRGSKEEKRLNEGKCSSIIQMDISFYENPKHIQILKLTNGEDLVAYSLIELISEKLRSLLQQAIRNRNRRQDIYDLFRLLNNEQTQIIDKETLLKAFMASCAVREITPNRNSLNDQEIRKRSSADWNTLKLEIGELPDFDECYDKVNKFYKQLPWENIVVSR